MNTKSKPVAPTLASIPNHAIASRARQIWEQEGCPAGHELDHWLQAERELQQESGNSPTGSGSRRQTPKPSASGTMAKTGLLGKPAIS